MQACHRLLLSVFVCHGNHCSSCCIDRCLLLRIQDQHLLLIRQPFLSFFTSEERFDFEEVSIVHVVFGLDLCAEGRIQNPGGIKCRSVILSFNNLGVEISKVAFGGESHARVHFVNLDNCLVGRVAQLHLDLSIEGIHTWWIALGRVVAATLLVGRFRACLHYLR